jgi:two-component system response regulator HydG
MSKILIIEDDTSFCQMLQQFLTKHRFEVTTAYSLEDAKSKLNTTDFDVILSDVRLPKGSGMGLLSRIKTESPGTQVILMTGYAEVKSAVDAIKNGAFDYISKPFTPEDILSVITKALNSKQGDETPQLNGRAKVAVNGVAAEKVLVGESERSKKLQEYVNLVAPTDMSVLLNGESGTGKEVTARAIHQASKRRGGKFVAVDCGSIPKELATSEFFGHVKGSFTGAIQDKIGHFEAANGGTLFLDEVGNLSYKHQIQLLRAIQERKVKRVGGTTEIPVDLRIISATNEDLIAAVKAGKFREDLYHRLNEFPIEVPSLKERAGDLMLFANFFLDRSNLELDKEVVEFSEETIELFHNYSWPGNLREMRNVVKRAVLCTEGAAILPESLPDTLKNGTSKPAASTMSKPEFEKERIMDALKRTNYNKSRAARLLRITRKTLYNKISRYQLEV